MDPFFQDLLWDELGLLAANFDLMGLSLHWYASVRDGRLLIIIGTGPDGGVWSWGLRELSEAKEPVITRDIFCGLYPEMRRYYPGRPDVR